TLHRCLLSFPTRRSSDLRGPAAWTHPSLTSSFLVKRSGSFYAAMAYVKSRRNTAMTIRHYREKRMTGKFEVYQDKAGKYRFRLRSEEHTSELQSRENLVC